MRRKYKNKTVNTSQIKDCLQFNAFVHMTGYREAKLKGIQTQMSNFSNCHLLQRMTNTGCTRVTSLQQNII